MSMKPRPLTLSLLIRAGMANFLEKDKSKKLKVVPYTGR